LSRISFGEYFKKLRLSKDKTQEEIANYIGKHKMLISGIEHGKNNPPKEEDLKKIAFELNLDEEERMILFQIAAYDRGTLPNEMVEYIIDNDIVFELIKTVKDNQFNTQQIKKLIDFCNEKVK
jgi:transcriptional regulator with XRE-family HTH domain